MFGPAIRRRQPWLHMSNTIHTRALATRATHNARPASLRSRRIVSCYNRRRPDGCSALQRQREPRRRRHQHRPVRPERDSDTVADN